MKPRRMKEIKELTSDELVKTLKEAEENLAKQKFQHALKQLHDTAYIRTLRKDIARMKTFINAK